MKAYYEYKIAWLPRRKVAETLKNSTSEAQAHKGYLGLSLERARELWKQGSQIGR